MEEKTSPLRALVTVVLHSDGYVEVWGEKSSLKAKMLRLWPGQRLPDNLQGSLLTSGLRRTGDRKEMEAEMKALTTMNNVSQRVGLLSVDAWQTLVDMARVTDSTVEKVLEAVYKERFNKP